LEGDDVVNAATCYSRFAREQALMMWRTLRIRVRAFDAVVVDILRSFTGGRSRRSPSAIIHDELVG